MSERLSAEQLAEIREYDHYYGYANTAIRRLSSHIAALQSDLAAANERLRLAGELAVAFDNLEANYQREDGAYSGDDLTKRLWRDAILAIDAFRATQPD